jgi:hypothetical protein
MTSPAAGATFDLVPLRFHFVARETMNFKPGTVGNLLRGSLGKNLKHLSCTRDCVEARSCPQRETCAYARWFEPASISGPSGLHDQPRPFVLRAAHLDGTNIAMGQPFCVGVNLFETSAAAVDVFTRAIASFAPVGSVTGTVPLRLPLAPTNEATRVRVRFLTPTELKGGDKPEFGVLFARIRDRVSTLRTLYGDGPINVDFRAMGERAMRIRTARCEIQSVDAERLSRRTGQRHSLGGFVGVSEYAGDLGEFVPYLKIARWTGVGRQTVWGKGEIDCEAF